MWRTEILFHAFDIDWTLPRLMFGLAAVSLTWWVISLTYILRRVGKQRALNDKELATLGRSPDPNQVRMHWVGAKGGRIEANANIDTLRNAAKRGDWLFFWAWPSMMLSAGGTVGMFLFGLLSSASDTPTAVYILLAVGILPFVLSPPFMAWAALYTNIDLGVDDPEESSTLDTSQGSGS